MATETSGTPGSTTSMETSATASGATTQTTTMGSSAGSTGSTGGSTAGTAGAVCGNGVIEPGEVCDEGDTDDLGCCNADCTERTPIVFITRHAGTGDIGGPEGADAICNQEAAEAGLPGTFRALLGADGVGPNDDASFFRSENGYCRADYVAFADSWVDLVLNGPSMPLVVKADGTAFLVGDTVFAWTGLDKDMQPTLNDCNAWTSADEALKGETGNPYQAGKSWLDILAATKCSNAGGHFYCFEQSVP